MMEIERHTKPFQKGRYSRKAGRLLTTSYIIKNWYWIVGAAILGLLISSIYIQTVHPHYTVNASLKYEESKSEISELSNIKNFYSRYSKTETEKHVILSREIVIKALLSVNHTVSFYKKSLFKDIELYPNVPFYVQILHKDRRFLDIPISINPVTNKLAELSYEQEGKIQTKRIQFGERICLRGLKFLIKPSRYFKKNTRYFLEFNSNQALLGRLVKELSAEEIKNTNIVELSLTDKNPVFGALVLNAIVEKYLDHDRIKKSTAATQTVAFIDKLLLDLHKAVVSSGEDIERIKMQYQALSISSVAEEQLREMVKLESEKHQLAIEDLELDRLLESIDAGQGKINIISSNNLPHIASLIEKVAELSFERQTSLSTLKPGAITIRNLDSDIDYLKRSLKENVQLLRMTNLQKRAFLNKHIDSLKSASSNLPEAERKFVKLQATYDINQKVFSYLSEKKLEAQISKAAAVPSAVVISRAFVTEKRVFPKPAKVYTLGLFAGSLLGYLALLSIKKLNPYIYNRETLEELTDLKIIGSIATFKTHRELPAKCIPALFDSKSLFAESVRGLRTNLCFLASDQDSKVVCITSELSGEGKSFIALNLAGILSLIEKKVILIGADLRKPALTEGRKLGLSDYLSGQARTEEIILSISEGNFDFISPGTLPPNPGELLYSQKMALLISVLKETYDYILLDTSPIGLVSDATPLMKLADINIYLIRCGFSRLHSPLVAERLLTELGLLNLNLVLNNLNTNTKYSSYYS